MNNARCYITSGDLNGVKRTTSKPFSTISTHNFVNKVELLFPESKFKSIYPELETSVFFFQLEHCSLSRLLQRKSLDFIKSKKLAFLTSRCRSDHQDVICITNGSLVLHLTHNTYQKSGLLGKKSAYKLGYGKKNSQSKYICSFELDTITQDLQYGKLLWFVENVLGPIELDGSPGVVLNDSDLITLENLTGCTINLQPIQWISEKLNVDTPALSPEHNEQWYSDTLEWIAYASINGDQLNTKTDSFLSVYEIEASKTNLIKVSWEAPLINSNLSTYLFSLLCKNTSEWSVLVQYGVVDSPVSWGNTEHVYQDGGENLWTLLQVEKKYVLWEIIGGADSY